MDDPKPESGAHISSARVSKRPGAASGNAANVLHKETPDG